MASFHSFTRAVGAAKAMAAALAATALLGGAAGTAQAQPADGHCVGRVVVSSIYQVSMGGNLYTYYVQLRNTAGIALRHTLTFANMPANVNLPATKLNGRTTANANEGVRFGTGSNSDINRETVLVYYDTASPASRPSVTLSGCYPG